MTPEMLSSILGCPVEQARCMLTGETFEPMVDLHSAIARSKELAAAGVTVGDLVHNFEVHFRQPNPYGATSLRVVMEHGSPALFAAEEGVDAAAPQDGPQKNEISSYEDAREVIEAILKWTVATTDEDGP